MKGYAQILMQPLLQRRAAGSLWLTWMLTALLVVGGAIAEVATGRAAIAGMALTIPLGALAFLWWGSFIESAVRQNVPLHAQLVPHLRGRFMRLTAMLWFAATLVGGCLSALAFGHFGVGLLATATGLLVVAALQRYPNGGAFPILAMFALNLIPHPAIHPWSLVECYGEAAVAAAGFALLAAAGAALLPALYLRGGDFHLRWQLKFASRLEVFKTGAAGDSGFTVATYWSRLQRLAYTMALLRASAAGATPAQMQMYALGPSAHWMRYTAMPVLLLMLAVPASILLDSSPLLSGLAPLYAIFFVMIALGLFVQNVNVAIYRTSTEQGLLRLTPDAVPHSIFNRTLARALLISFFKLWLVCAASAIMVAKIFGGAKSDWAYLLSLAVFMLPFSALLLRDYAAMSEPSGSSATALTAGGVLLLLLVLSALKTLLWPQIWTAIGIASVLLTALLLVRGWRRMMAMPAAFPARRMA